VKYLLLPPRVPPSTNTLLVFAVWLTGCVALHAELKWDAQQIELKPLATDTSVETKFGFVNAGAAAVVIEDVHSSCGCTIPSLPKTTCAPGERGEIQVRFNIGDRRGMQTKTIRVAVKGEANPTVLTLVVSIPEPARITPAMLVWEKGEAGNPKMISVQALPNQPVRVLRVSSSLQAVQARVETIQEAVEYRIVVTPGNTMTPGFALLTVETELMGRKKVLTAYAQIRPK